MKIPTIALIGVSGFASYHYEEILEWQANNRIRLIAATVVNQNQEPEKVDALRKASCHLFCDYKEMFASIDGNVDLCVIPTGIHLHTEMALAALERGCNVLLEKPVAPTIQEVNLIAEAAEKAGKSVSIGYQHMYTPEIATIKRSVVAGMLGKIQCIKCNGVWPRPHSYYTRNNWAGRLSLGNKWVLDSPFGNAFAHWLNLLCFLAGSSFDVSATPKSIRSELYRTYPIESPDTACMEIETEEGIPLFFWGTHSSSDGFDPILEVRGEKSSLIWTVEKVVFRDSNGEVTVSPTCPFKQAKKLMYKAVLEEIQGGQAFTCGIPIARNQTICSNGALECTPIHSISERYFSTVKTKDDYQNGIFRMSDICREAFRKEKLWSEMGIDWAMEPGNADLRNYSEFKSVKDSSSQNGIITEGIHSVASSI